MRPQGGSNTTTPRDTPRDRSKNHPGFGVYSQSLEFESSPHYKDDNLDSLELQRTGSTETQYLLAGNKSLRDSLTTYQTDGETPVRPRELMAGRHRSGSSQEIHQGICPLCATLVHLSESHCPRCGLELTPQPCVQAHAVRRRTASDATSLPASITSATQLLVLGRHALASEASTDLAHHRDITAHPEESEPFMYSERDTTDHIGAVDMPRRGRCLRLRQLLAFTGVGLIIAVGYMDPGNWATNLEAGSRFGYSHLFVVLLSSVLAMFLEFLALKLGIAANKDLAQACRTYYGTYLSFFLWVASEIAICATDLAEIIGTAVGLNLLFGTPLFIGICIAVLDVFFVLLFFHNSTKLRYLELMVGAIIVMIFAAFSYELALTHPEWLDAAKGLLPDATLITQRDKLVVAAGILGATVMPHSLFLHSHLVRTRDIQRTKEGIEHAVQAASLDSMISLVIAFFVNAAILMLSASAFYNPITTHETSTQPVTDITDAFLLLSPTLGSQLASTVFALALLGSGHNSSITGTLAGSVVMEGFLAIKLAPWIRRLLTRIVAVVPAAIVAWIFGSAGVGRLLLWSQVLLSAQLAFAVVPLVHLTSQIRVMGDEHVNSTFTRSLAILAAGGIIVLNLVLILQNIF